MKIDLYTRVILTGILVCLVWLCVVLTPFGTSLTAQAVPGLPVQDVRIVGVKQPDMSQSVAPGAAARPVGDWDALPTYTAAPTKTERAR